MPTLTLHAPAKLNLTLDVLGKRPDGYHDLSMVMTSVDFGDTVTLTYGTGEPIQARSNLHFLPNNEKNLAVKAALKLMEHTGCDPQGLLIDLDKRIPVCAGMGGGSSDAAAVLRGLNQIFGSPCTLEELAQLGASVGSDVPYCVLGGTALAQGKGEILTPLSPLPPCTIVLCKPGFPVSTPALFAKLDGQKVRHHPDTSGMLTALEKGDLLELSRRMFNVFEEVLIPRDAHQIQDIKQVLLSQGALGACMSGTGSTVFGLFDDPKAAQSAFELLAPQHKDTVLTQPV